MNFDVFYVVVAIFILSNQFGLEPNFEPIVITSQNNKFSHLHHTCIVFHFSNEYSPYIDQPIYFSFESE
jgi:hypothetical protein